MKYLFNLVLGNQYLQCHLESLAINMDVPFTISQDITVGHIILVKNKAISFTFECIERYCEIRGDKNFFKLTDINQHLTAETGASIVATRDYLGEFKRGDTGKITRYENGMGWFALIGSGEWNIGHGDGFIVIASAQIAA